MFQNAVTNYSLYRFKNQKVWKWVFILRLKHASHVTIPPAPPSLTLWETNVMLLQMEPQCTEMEYRSMQRNVTCDIDVKGWLDETLNGSTANIDA